MVQIKLADFYYGSVLSFLFCNQIMPALVETNEDRQVYDVTTNNGQYRIYLKYSAKPKHVKKQDYDSWSFTFNSSDIDQIKEYLSASPNLVILLVCGKDGLADSELVPIEKADIRKLFFELNKKSIAISRLKNEQAYRIAIGGGRDKSMLIKTNALEQIIR